MICSNKLFHFHEGQKNKIATILYSYTFYHQWGLLGRTLYNPITDDTVPNSPTQKQVSFPDHRNPSGNQCTAFMRSERVWRTVNIAMKRWYRRTRMRVLLLPLCWSSNVTLFFTAAAAELVVDISPDEQVFSFRSFMLILWIVATAWKQVTRREIPQRMVSIVQNQCDWMHGRSWLSAAHAMCSSG